MYKGTELADIWWNLITFLIYQGQTGMLDWVIENYNVSLQDALQDSGPSAPAPLNLLGHEISSIGIYLGLIPWRNKVGLIHLAEKYPESIPIQDWESILMVILKHHDYESLRILATWGMKAAFNLLAVNEGVEKITNVCQ